MTTPVTDVEQPNYKYQQMQRVQLTPEESKALMECLRNTSVLVPALISAAAGFGVCRITRFSAYAKYVGFVSGAVGLVTGRIAVSELCLAKVAAMPNSNLRERLIEARYRRSVGESLIYGEKQHQGFQPMDVQTEIQSSEEPGIVFDDYPSMNKYDTYSSINGSDLPLAEETDLTEPINLQKGVSYDELRNKNRDEFYKKNRQWYPSRTPREPAVERQPPQQTPDESARSPIGGMQEKTKYGDVWG